MLMPEDESHDDKTQSFIALTSGTSVLHYKILEKIGSGGMGEVYLALDTKLNRKVALKFLPPHLCQDEDCLKRFTREAQAAAGLDHPNIATIHEVGDFQGRPFYAMQIVDGQSLKDVIAGKDLSFDRILEIGIQVCEGLQAAHTKGIVHRDIKPSNILLDGHGRVRIVDFGLAAIRGSEQLTKTGSTLGTIGYMSPEQIEGKETDARSDLFSLGVVLYELIANRSPFRRDDETATLRAILQDTPEPLARYKSGVPDDLQRIVSKLLEKDPTLRYQSAAGVIPDLKKLSSRSTASMVIEKRRDRWNRYVVASAMVVVLAVLATWYFGFLDRVPTPSSEDDRIMLAVLPFQNLGDPEDEYFADGITDEITSRLTKLENVGVISRTSAIRYKNSEKDLPEIAGELGVGFILEGTIRWDKTGKIERIRITPQLIRVSDNTHLWAENYERELNQIFAVQADIASNISAALDVSLRQSAGRAGEDLPTTNMEAYQAYLRGQHYGQSPDFYFPKVVNMAIDMYARATHLDSSFAEAYAALARCHILKFHTGLERSVETKNVARQAAERAYALKPNSVDALLAMGRAYYSLDLDYDSAHHYFLQATTINPGDLDALRSLADVQRRLGMFERAIENQRRVVTLDPKDATNFIALGMSYEWVRRWEEAERCYLQAMSLAPDSFSPYSRLSELYVKWGGDVTAARRVLERAPEEHRPYILNAEADLDGLARDYQAAIAKKLELIELLGEEKRYYRNLAYDLARLYYANGDYGNATKWADSLLATVESWLQYDQDNRVLHQLAAHALAIHGRYNEAIDRAKKACDLLPISKDAVDGPGATVSLAAIYAEAGEEAQAFDLIDSVLTIPSWLSVQQLRLDPAWDPLRDNPRFQSLIKRHVKKQGA